MPGFAALLAAFAVLSLPSGGSVDGVEMRSSAAAGQRSAQPQPEATAAGAAPGDPGGCPGRCRCEADGRRLDCSDLGLRELPANLSALTSYL